MFEIGLFNRHMNHNETWVEGCGVGSRKNSLHVEVDPEVVISLP